MHKGITRRELLGTSLGAAAGFGLSTLPGAARRVSAAEPVAPAKTMIKRNLGRTGHQVGLFSLGGESTVEREDRKDEAIEIVQRALDRGVNYIDTAHIYGGGGSEKNIGEALEGRRGDVFLASKTRDRGYDGTMYQFETSLERLRTDYLDLYQLHNMRHEQDLEEAFADDGALKAMEKLRDEGVVRYLGITGHRDPEILLKGIRDYDFDCILLTMNPADQHYRPFQNELLDTAVDKNMGIIAMKVTARGNIFHAEGVQSMKQVLDYVWSLPVSTAIVGITELEQVEENADLACGFAPLSTGQFDEISDLTAMYEEEANFFKYHW